MNSTHRLGKSWLMLSLHSQLKSFPGASTMYWQLRDFSSFVVLLEVNNQFHYDVFSHVASLSCIHKGPRQCVCMCVHLYVMISRYSPYLLQKYFHSFWLRTRAKTSISTFQTTVGPLYVQTDPMAPWAENRHIL